MLVLKVSKIPLITSTQKTTRLQEVHQDQHKHTQLRPTFQQNHTHKSDLAGKEPVHREIKSNQVRRRRRGHPRRSSLSHSLAVVGDLHENTVNCITEITPRTPWVLLVWVQVNVAIHFCLHYSTVYEYTRLSRETVSDHRKWHTFFLLRGILSHAHCTALSLSFPRALQRVSSSSLPKTIVRSSHQAKPRGFGLMRIIYTSA